MPNITLTSPVFARDVGDEMTVTREQARWATTNGYAVYTDSPRLQEKAVDPGQVSYTAEDDPTLAANREGPDEGHTPGVDDKTVSGEQSNGSTSGASQDRTGAASGTQDASPEEVDALMAQEDGEPADPADPAAEPTPDAPLNRDGSPQEQPKKASGKKS